MINKVMEREVFPMTEFRSTPITQALNDHGNVIKSRRLLWLIILISFSFICWTAYAEVDELVRGVGKVIPSKQLQLVQNLEGGILSELLVEEGEEVEAGQVLLKLDDKQLASRFREREQVVRVLQARSERLRAEAQGGELSFSESLVRDDQALVREQQALFTQRLEQLRASKVIISQQIQQKHQLLDQLQGQLRQSRAQELLVKKELAILEPLFEQGVVSEVELIRSEKSVLEAKGRASDIELKLPQIESSIKELTNRRAQLELDFRSESRLELNDVLAELAQMSQGHDVLEDRVDRTQVRSPVNGIVKELMVTTLGGVIQPGMDLVSVVPMEDALLIETKVRPADIARLYPGQKAMVKFTAYDFTVYGGLEAELVHISADSSTNEQGDSFYLVRVKT
ncbi:HlyD family type I secretion periplasmic adaptor subunit, partial [Oleiphilus sp. HI0086]|uniref:HlyD family type I secretion periplasmic adaptor subunit n=1 Tax=Oleiphilus sp. HI0086 TaxID=1822260 RepID=UPI0012E7B522